MNAPVRARFRVTHHAAERYVERIDGRVNHATARSILARVLESGFVCVGHQDGTELYRDPRRPMHIEVVVVGGWVVTVMDPARQTNRYWRGVATSERAHAESCGEAAVVCAAESQGEAACARSGAEGRKEGSC